MHARISINSNCFPGAGWPELAAIWHALGPQRVGFVGTLLESDPAGAEPVFQAGAYKLETIIQPFMFGYQLDASDAVKQREQEKLCQIIGIAAALGARSMFVATGGRGTLTWEEAAAEFSAVIAPCAAHAAANGIILMIENTPPLYAHLHIAHSLRDTVTLAEIAGLGLCIDVFSCWTEAGLRQTIERGMPLCDLIQVADYVYGDRALPARAVPGDGAIPLHRMFDWALSAGFRGAFDLEMMGPRIDAEGHLAAARRGAENLGEILRGLGV